MSLIRQPQTTLAAPPADPIERILATPCPVGHCHAGIGEACDEYEKPRHGVDEDGVGRLGPYVKHQQFHGERIRAALTPPGGR